MLQMSCPHCGGIIKSPLLAEVQLFVCSQCEEIVVVKDVVISTQNIATTFHSNLKNLLLSAKDKFNRNKSNNTDIQTRYNFDKRLAKLLRRDDFRLDMSHDIFVQINFGNNNRSARLLNISSTGAAIEIYEQGELPANDSETRFQLMLQGHPEPLSLLARVVWSRKPAEGMASPTVTMGLQFKNTDEKERSCLWDFIVRSETSTQT
jgi:hypothetical protein